MNTIEIFIKAYGYKEDSYDEKEIIRKKTVEKDNSHEQLTQKELQQVLEFLIFSIKELKKQYPDKQSNVLNQYTNRLVSIKFTITLKNDKKTILTLEEETFFKVAVKYEELTSFIVDYYNVTNHGEEGTRIWITDEYDLAPPAGTYAALALVDNDQKWIPNYIDFLKSNDLEHEVDQIWHIKSIIEKYGWSKATCRLAIARNVSCCGQNGNQQFNSFLDNGLKTYINSKMTRIDFFKLALEEFNNWKQLHIRLKNNSKKQFSKYIIVYTEHFNNILHKEEIKELQTILLEKWDSFHQK